MYSASAFAANTILRSGVAAAFPLFVVQMFTKVSSICFYIALPSNFPLAWYKLGMHFARPCCTRVCPLSVPVL